MSAGLIRQIDKAFKDEDQKSVLKQIVQLLDPLGKYRDKDLIFTKGKPVVLNADDGHYYSIGVSSTTPAIELTDLGRKVP